MSSMQILTRLLVAVGDRGYAPSQGGTNVFSISDSMDMIRGKHEIHVGIGIRAHQLNVRANAFQDGFFLGDAFDSAMTLTARSCRLDSRSAEPFTTRRSKEPPAAVAGRCIVPMYRTIGVRLPI